MNAPRLDDLAVHRPDLSALRAATDARVRALREARSLDEELAVLRAWDEARRQLDTHFSLAAICFTRDTRDAAARADKDHFDAIAPDVEAMDREVIEAVLASPRREALARRLGAHAFAAWEVSMEALDPRTAEDKRAISTLSSEYSALTAGLEFEVDGEVHTLSTVRRLYGDPDRARRQRAVSATAAALGGRAGRLDSLYDELVQRRHAMARTMGHDTFTPFGYRLLYRTGYGPEGVEVFRQQILDHVVPLAGAVHRARAARLGLDALAYHDEGVPDLAGKPRPMGEGAWLMDRAGEMFDALGEDFSSFFAMMRDRGLMDLDARPGKAGGGYCDGLNGLGVPFIFANFNGTADDVDVFTHECGHAFQYLQSARALPLRDLFWPTMEAAEICSMALEHLCYPHMERFFGDDAARYRRVHMEDGVTFLPYAALVDHFQHEVYADPGCGAQARADRWRSLESRYLPHRRYVDAPHYAGGRVWQRQAHIYSAPFYYIDYALALTCAWQLADLAERDHGEAMRAYRRLAALGGSLAFSELVAAAGLADPMRPGTLERVVDGVARRLDL